MTSVLVALMKARASLPGVALSLLLVGGVLARCRYEARLSRRARGFADAAVWIALIALAGLTAFDAAANVKWYRTWDFPSFYGVARATVRGLAFYDPQVLMGVQRELTQTAGVPDEWLKEGGYWYLPPSVFLLWPLGLFGFRTALMIHYAVQAAFLAGSAWLLHRSLPIGRGPVGLAMMLLLMLLFRPVQSTVTLAQIVFGCLFFLLLSERLLERSGAASGASLAVGFLYKHVLMIPAILMIASRDRRSRVAGVSALVAIAAAMVASALVFGRNVFGAFVANGPGARSPELAVDPVVQSLLALLHRALGDTPRGSLLAIISYPPYLLVAGALTIVTLALLLRSPAPARRERLWLLTSLAVLCYPNTLFSTLALLFPVVIGVCWTALRRGNRFGLALGFVTIVYAVAGFLPLHAGWIAALCWGAVAVLMIRGEPTGSPGGVADLTAAAALGEH